MATVNSFEDLKVWQKARTLSIRIFQLTSSGKFMKDYGLIDQINRSTGSVMDNIAEGFGRLSNKEFINFLTYSHASASECKSQLFRAFDRAYISEEELNSLIAEVDEIRKMINAFIFYLNNTTVRGFKFKDRICK